MEPHTFEHDVADRSNATLETELLTLNANLNAATCRFLVLIRESRRLGRMGCLLHGALARLALRHRYRCCP